MPILGSFGAGAASGFGQRQGGPKFVAATGGCVTTDGDFKVHTFNASGCFVVSCGGNEGGSNTVDYLVIAGGGGGGRYFGGGGGAGGFRISFDSPKASCTPIEVSTQTYPIQVGGGGGASPQNGQGSNGSTSIFSTITSSGGGGGRVDQEVQVRLQLFQVLQLQKLVVAEVQITHQVQLVAVLVVTTVLTQLQDLEIQDLEAVEVQNLDHLVLEEVVQ